LLVKIANYEKIVYESKLILGVDLAKIIVKAILLLEDAGVQVIGITGDGASTNRTMWNILGVSGKVDKFKNTFSNPFNDSHQVYIFSDPPHLLKTVRNRLYTKRTLRVSYTIFLGNIFYLLELQN